MAKRPSEEITEEIPVSSKRAPGTPGGASVCLKGFFRGRGRRSGLVPPPLSPLLNKNLILFN